MTAETRSSVILLPPRQSILLFLTLDVLPLTRQATSRKEKAPCFRESANLAVSAGVIIRGQKSIPTAWTSGISTNMPQAATGTHASANSTSKAARAPRQHQPVHRRCAVGPPG